MFVFLGQRPWHSEVPRLGVKLELGMGLVSVIFQEDSSGCIRERFFRKIPLAALGRWNLMQAGGVVPALQLQDRGEVR